MGARTLPQLAARYEQSRDYIPNEKQIEQSLVNPFARALGYIGQLHDLRFGLMADGCHYPLYHDLQPPNITGKTPFIKLSLSDEKLDISTVAAFLNKSSRGQFTSDRLVVDAEDSNYRQGQTRKLAPDDALEHAR